MRSTAVKLAFLIFTKKYSELEKAIVTGADDGYSFRWHKYSPCGKENRSDRSVYLANRPLEKIFSPLN